MSNAIREYWYRRFMLALQEGAGTTLLVTTNGSVIAIDPAAPAPEQTAWIFTAQAGGILGAGPGREEIAREAANSVAAWMLRPSVEIHILAPNPSLIRETVKRIAPEFFLRSSTRAAERMDRAIRTVAALTLGTNDKADIRVARIPGNLNAHLPSTLQAITEGGKIVLIEHAVRLTRAIRSVDGLFVVRRVRNAQAIFRTEGGALIHMSAL